MTIQIRQAGLRTLSPFHRAKLVFLGAAVASFLFNSSQQDSA